MHSMPDKTWIKICGITSTEDAVLAAECGADAIGFVFAESKRRIHPAIAKKIVRSIPSNVMIVGVFMNEKPGTIRAIVDEVDLDVVQLHGLESPEDCRKINRKVIKRFSVEPGDSASALKSRMRPYPVFACLLDPGAGDGIPFDWNMAEGIPFRFIVAGGLTALNVGEVVRKLKPFGVDVSSGVESTPGKKDMDQIHQFIKEVRNVQYVAG